MLENGSTVQTQEVLAPDGTEGVILIENDSARELPVIAR